MAFLTDNDYHAHVKGSILATVISSQVAIRTDAENKAQAEMIAYLRVRYDTTAIFAATGGGRNAAIVMYLVDMVLYHLHSRIQAGQVPQLRMDRYDAAVNWLKLVAAGKLDPDLPVPSGSDEGVKNDVKWGSREARNPYY